MNGSRARRSIGSEEGIALMEVVISAAVLLPVVLGVMAGLDAVAGTAGANKARTVAAVLAEKDQEELRSLKTADLNQLESLIPDPRTVMVDGLPYTIKSEARLITDAQGENISCALDDGEGMTVVTWPSATTRWERRMPLPENGVIYVDRNGDCTLQAPRQINYGVNGEHKCAILTVRGTYPKSMTLGSEDDILIDDDLVARTTCTNDDLRYRSPSYFLDPLQAAWRVVRANQQVPAAR